MKDIKHNNQQDKSSQTGEKNSEIIAEPKEAGNANSSKNIPAQETPQTQPGQPKQPPDPAELLNEKIKQLNELNDKYLRLYAEFENYRKRAAKERIETLLTAAEGVVKAVLPVLDDLERAIKSGEQTQDINAIKEGEKLIFGKLMNILENIGVKPMETGELDFNPDLHDAVSHLPAPDKKQKGKILDVIEKGYLLNGKVIRYAKVVVGT